VTRTLFWSSYRRHQGGLYRYGPHMSEVPQSAADGSGNILTLILHAGKYYEEKAAPSRLSLWHLRGIIFGTT